MESRELQLSATRPWCGGQQDGGAEALGPSGCLEGEGDKKKKQRPLGDRCHLWGSVGPAGVFPRTDGHGDVGASLEVLGLDRKRGARQGKARRPARKQVRALF